MSTPPTNIADWFVSPAVQKKHGLTGNRYEDGVVLLGDKAGPKCDDDTLCHEMSHFIEIDDERCMMASWGLYMGKYNYIPGQYGGSSWYERDDAAPSERETRVMAIQSIIMVHCGLDFDFREHAEVLDFMFDYHHFAHVFDGEDGEYTYEERKRGGVFWDVVASAMASHAEEYTIDELWTEWLRKIAIVEARELNVSG